jgi:hypothetical protein
MTSCYIFSFFWFFILATSWKDRMKLFVHGIINHDLKSKVLLVHMNIGLIKRTLLLLFYMIIWLLYLILFLLRTSCILCTYKLIIAGEKTKILPCFVFWVCYFTLDDSKLLKCIFCLLVIFMKILTNIFYLEYSLLKFWFAVISNIFWFSEMDLQIWCY